MSDSTNRRNSSRRVGSPLRVLACPSALTPADISTNHPGTLPTTEGLLSMTIVKVQRSINAPIETVFDAYTDHAALALVPGILSATVVRPGNTEPNGLGAVREVNATIAWFREEITAFERPVLMEYRIQKARPSLRHRLGRVEFEPTAPGTTLITWTSEFDAPLPGIGFAFGPVGKLVASTAFSWVLKCLDDRIGS
ncbi:SRPBCC family protein [Nocardia neocaledoniensis]|uniref:SRPBCC family protein n=1 Tax=Nocardia neocaledoniensis TaxID=236511 RepID=UPI0024573A45|nr:SRPBCC family protein [Nocardia neocaledoniensis]